MNFESFIDPIISLDILVNSHFSFCPKPCTTLSISTTKFVENQETRDSGYTRISLNINPMVRVTQSVEKKGPVSLLNDFGSSMGLWLGISVMSIFEMMRNFGLQMKVGETWKVVPNLIVIFGSLFSIGIGCLFFYFTIK